MDTTTPKQHTPNSGSPRGNTGGGYRGNNNRGPKREGGDSKPRTFFERPKPEFDQKMVSIRRVTRVVAGGRRMTFAVALAIGDKKGSIGLGTGKGGDTSLAIAKALRQAKKNMFKIKTTKEMSIPYQVSAKFSSSKLTMMPNRGKGLVAGSTVRDILILGGLKNVTAKLHSGSKNKLNNARVAYKTLYLLKAVATLPKIAPFIADAEVEVKEEIKEKAIIEEIK
ncbi:MAG: 30S ribosomal protein S5 [Candidatus Paceibacterota bacterium]